MKEKLILLRQWSEYLTAIISFTVPRFLAFKIDVLVQKYGELLFFITYFTFLVCSIYILNKNFNLAIEISIARDFFLAAGAMVGGTLAIVVSFALFTVQQAAEQLPKDFYRLATNIKKYLIIFLADVLIALLLFCGALTYGQLKIGMSGFSMQIGLLIVGISFYLILLLLNSVKSDVDKDKILIKAVNSLLLTIQQIRTRTTKFAQAQLLHPSNRGKFTLEQILANLYLSPPLQLQLVNLNRELDYLFDYHDHFVSSNQKRAALEVLEGVRQIVSNYLLLRKDSSIAFPEANSLMVLTSDSQYILQPILDRSVSLGEGYVKSEDTAGIIMIINVFIEWSRQAAQIKYTGLTTPENPILEQITGYLDQLMDRTMKYNSLEGMYQGLRYYKAISVLCIEKSYIHILSSIIGKIESVGYKGMLSKQDPVLGEAFTTYSEILKAIFTFHPSSLEHYFIFFSKHLNNLILYGYTYTSKGGLRDNLVAQQDVAKPHNTILELIHIARSKARENSETVRNIYQSVTLELVEQLRKSLRQLSEQMKNPNHMLIHSYGQIIENVGVLLIKLANEPEWIKHHSLLLVEVKSYLHLPTWFLHNINNFESNQSFDSLIEAITSIGMASLIHEDMDDISIDSIKVLSSKAIEFIDKQKSDDAMYLESDVMEHACYIGILAIKMNKYKHVEILKSKISEFETKYKYKYYSDALPEGLSPYSISPPADKLKKDIKSLYQKRRGGWTDRFGMGMVDDSADRLMNSVSEDDILNFITEIWGEE